MVACQSRSAWCRFTARLNRRRDCPEPDSEQLQVPSNGNGLQRQVRVSEYWRDCAASESESVTAPVLLRLGACGLRVEAAGPGSAGPPVAGATDSEQAICESRSASGCKRNSESWQCQDHCIRSASERECYCLGAQRHAQLCSSAPGTGRSDVLTLHQIQMLRTLTWK